MINEIDPGQDLNGFSFAYRTPRQESGHSRRQVFHPQGFELRHECSKIVQIFEKFMNHVNPDVGGSALGAFFYLQDMEAMEVVKKESDLVVLSGALIAECPAFDLSLIHI